MSSINKINELVHKIEDGIYSQHQLNFLYKNAVDNNHPEVQLAVQDALLKISGSQYTKKFIQPIRSKIEALIYEIAHQHDWLSFPKNEVKNGIKLGGYVKHSKFIADFYFSYKQKGWKRSLAFAVLQKDISSEIYYSINSPGIQGEIQFQNIDDALQLFNSELAELMG